MTAPRYDDKTGIYRDCRWCRGTGCVHCKAEADAEYKRQFPQGPKLVATFKLNSKSDMKLLRDAIGPKAVMKAKEEGDRRAAALVRRLGHGEVDPNIVRDIGTGFAGEILKENLEDAQRKTRRRKKK